MKKGFTLIELLAVVMVLVMVIVIVVPAIARIIDDAAKGTFEASIHSLVRVAENECVEKRLTDSPRERTYYFNEYEQSVSPPGEDLLVFQGNNPKTGYLSVDLFCTVELELSDGTWQATKDSESSEIVIELIEE